MRVAAPLLAVVLVGCGADPAGGETAGGTGAGSTSGDPATTGTGTGEEPEPCTLEPADEAYVDGLVHRGRGEGDTFIEILDVVADGNLVYSCTGTQGVTIWDATDPAAPTLLVENIGPHDLAHPQFPRCQHLALDEARTRALITNRGDEVQPTPWLALYDVQDPAAPALVATWSGEESVEGVVVRGDRVYAAAHRSGLMAFDVVGDGLQPVGSFADEQSDGWQPLFVGDHLYVAEGANGVRVYDVTGNDPVPVASVALPGSSKDLVLEGDAVYVASSSHLVALDVSDPAAPAILSETPVVGTALALAAGPDQIVYTAEWDEVRGYDVSDPSAVRSVVAESLPTDDDFSRVLALDASPDGRIYGGEWEGMHVLEAQAGAAAPDISVTPANVQFGLVQVGDAADRVVVVRNTGDRPLRIFEADTDHEEVSVAQVCMEIPPGESAAVEVRYAPLDDTFSLQARLAFRTDDPDEEVFIVRVSGNFSGVGVGEPVPTFDLTDLEGNIWRSEELRGQVLVLAYFATF